MQLTKDTIRQADFAAGCLMLVDKPFGLTSFKVVHKLRSRISDRNKTKLKIGHAGTLDPLATGLLILCTGKMTRQIDSYQALVKEYSGIITLGATRPTFDMESPINEVFNWNHIQSEQIELVRQGFLGEQWMTPPIHSAVQIQGKRAYELARKGLEPQLEPRLICIDSLKVDSSNLPELHFNVVCSKGTYIRSLANEFGKRLSSGAYLAALRREAIGNYSVDSAWNLEELLDLLN